MKHIDEDIMYEDMSNSNNFVIFGCFKKVYNQLSGDNNLNISDGIQSVCEDSNSFFNTSGDFVFLLINCIIYLSIVFYKLLQIIPSKERTDKKNESEKTNYEEIILNNSYNVGVQRKKEQKKNRYTFFLKNFYLSNKEYKQPKENYEKNRNPFFYFIQKLFNLKRGNNVDENNTTMGIYKYGEKVDSNNYISEDEININNQLNSEGYLKNDIYMNELNDNYNNDFDDNTVDIEMQISEKSNIKEKMLYKETEIDKYYKGQSDDDNDEEKNFNKISQKYILKNLNIKMRPYKIYTFSSIFNNDLNILYFFKYFFCNNKDNLKGSLQTIAYGQNYEINNKFINKKIKMNIFQKKFKK